MSKHIELYYHSIVRNALKPVKTCPINCINANRETMKNTDRVSSKNNVDLPDYAAPCNMFTLATRQQSAYMTILESHKM